MGAAPIRSALAGFATESLLEGVTPIQRLSRLEAALGAAAGGVRLFVKRDDLMGLGGGGNKLRKLEFLLGEAKAQGCDTFITTGALQSNHARLSAAASARAGLACELVLRSVVPRDDADYLHSGNQLLDPLFGARVHRLPGDADAMAFADERAADLRGEGRRAYVVGAGGSSSVGCLGYAVCAAEILEQEAALDFRFARIVVANGSSGTHAGLAAGMVLADEPARRVQSYTALAPLDVAMAATGALVDATLAGLGAAPLAEPPEIDGSQLGDGYGIPTAAMLHAVRLMARTEGLLLDPVYSGKAFAGLLAAVRQGHYAPGDAVLFVMTGGTPGLYAYRSIFEEEEAA